MREFDITPMSTLISETNSDFSGWFLRCEVLEYLPKDDMMAASSTCQAMRNSVRERIGKDEKIALPNESHILQQVPLLEWAIKNGYQIIADCSDDDRLLKLFKPDTWIRRLGTFSRACLIGNITVLKYLLSLKNCYDNRWLAIKFAAFGGHLDCVKYLFDMPYVALPGVESLQAEIAISAGYGGHVEILKWLVSNSDDCSCELYRFAAYYAVLNDQDSVINLLVDVGFEWTSYESYSAAEGGHLKRLQWLISKECPLPNDITNIAATGGSKAMLEWLIGKGCTLDPLTCCGAAFGGHIDILQFLLERGCPTPAEEWRLIFSAASGGSVPMIRWLVEKGYPMNEKACNIAAQEGQLLALQTLQELGCPWDSTTTEAAANHGRINTLRWALANGCPVTSAVVTEAAHGKQFAILEFLLESQRHLAGHAVLDLIRADEIDEFRMLLNNGYPISQEALSLAVDLRRTEFVADFLKRGCVAGKSAIRLAVTVGQVDILEKFMEFRSSDIVSDVTFVALAVSKGHADVLQLLLDNGCPITPNAAFIAIEAGNLELLRILVENGCSVTPSLLIAAAENYNTDCLDLLVSEGEDSVASEAIKCAIGKGDLDVVEMLVDVVEMLIDDRDAITESSVYLAASSGHLEVLKWLVEDYECSFYDACRCLEAAVKNNHHDVVAWLKSTGV